MQTKDVLEALESRKAYLDKRIKELEIINHPCAYEKQERGAMMHCIDLVKKQKEENILANSKGEKR